MGAAAMLRLRRASIGLVFVGAAVMTAVSCAPIDSPTSNVPTAVVEPSGTRSPPFLVKVATTDGVFALVRERDGLALVATDVDGGLDVLTRVADRPGETTVHLFAWGGQTGRTFNSFMFGNAPPGTASVDAGVPGGIPVVSAGRYLVALTQKDLIPPQILWTFRAADGAVIASGVGIVD